MRGDVHRLRAGRDARGHEQQGRRFGVVVQASRYAHLSTWLVAPTSRSAQQLIFRPEILLPVGPTLVLVDATVAVDPEQRLGEYVTTITFAELTAIDVSLRGLLDLD